MLLVEGGGDTKRACREAFQVFLKKILTGRPKPIIVACGSRGEAYKDFCREVKKSDFFPLLLVDSEDPVSAGLTASAHLKQRDHWKNLPEEQAHLMVQCMESWFLADKDALAKHYGRDFKVKNLPGHLNIEEIPKQDVMRGLEAATRATSKKSYHKTKHGFEILEKIDPSKVGNASPFAKRFFDALVKS